MTYPKNRIFNTVPVANRQLIGGSMVIDMKNQYRTHLKLGKWRLTEVEPPHRLGLVVDVPKDSIPINNRINPIYNALNYFDLIRNGLKLTKSE